MVMAACDPTLAQRCKCIEWSGLNDYLKYKDGLEYLEIRPQGTAGPVRFSEGVAGRLIAD